MLRASARVYLLPVAGLLVGAALAQFVAGAFLPPEASGRAAALGGIAGAVGAVLLARRLGAGPNAAGVLPRISRVIESGSSGARAPAP